MTAIGVATMLIAGISVFFLNARRRGTRAPYVPMRVGACDASRRGLLTHPGRSCHLLSLVRDMGVKR